MSPSLKISPRKYCSRSLSLTNNNCSLTGSKPKPIRTSFIRRRPSSSRMLLGSFFLNSSYNPLVANCFILAKLASGFFSVIGIIWMEVFSLTSFFSFSTCSLPVTITIFLYFLPKSSRRLLILDSFTDLKLVLGNINLRYCSFFSSWIRLSLVDA